MVGGGTNPFVRGTARAPDANVREAAEETMDPFAGDGVTPLRAHYLKKMLFSLQLRDELRMLQDGDDALALLGPPFRQHENSAPANLPLLRHIFRRFVLTFPFFADAPPDFFPGKVQVFVNQLLQRNLILVDGLESGASSLLSRLEKYLCLLLSSALRVVPDGEDIVRISETDRERLSAMEAQVDAARGAQARGSAASMDVNVVCVRSVVERGRLRNRVRNDFVICTKAAGSGEVYVARRYGDVYRLHYALRAKLSDEDIPRPPAKDRRATTVDDSAAQTGDGDAPLSLSRERNRLALRVYLRTLLAIPAVAESQIMRDFLVDDPVTLTEQEHGDVAARRHADELRERERARFAQETADRVRELRSHFASFKADLAEPDGLSRMFHTIRQCPRVENLPVKYRVLVEWAESSMASALFSAFVANDTASQSFAQLKYMHASMPYFMVRSILRISNPVAMIRSLLDLFLAQPFGQKSLLQRMFAGRLQEEIGERRELADQVAEKIHDPLFARKIDAFIAAPAHVQQALRTQTHVERIDIVTAIMRAPLGGALHAMQVHRVVAGSRAYEALKRARRHAAALGLPEVEPDSEEAWLYEDLHVYMNLGKAIYEKGQLISLMQDSATTELIKDMITIFYAPLAQVYKAANIGDTLSDVQVFLTDLIRTVEENEQILGENPQLRVRAFLALVHRHENLFYNFIYQVHTNGSHLFDRLVHWVELFINYVRGAAVSGPAARSNADSLLADLDGESYGLGKINLEQLLAAGPADRGAVLRQVDEVIEHAYRRKLMREVKLRRKMARQEVAAAAHDGSARDATAEHAMFEALTEQFGLGDLFHDQVADADSEGTGTSDGEDAASDASDSDDDDEGPEDAEHFRHHPKQLRTHAQPRDNRADQPASEAVRALLPAFMAQVCGGGLELTCQVRPKLVE
ncbi:hypothetical protein MSPP1_003776 [Malassezia sp. CBS 17886]|nr:hypothetical protein MSPP1_003776 [Malassezia sp. CBS 17886]